MAGHEPGWGGGGEIGRHTGLGGVVDRGGPRGGCSLPDWYGERANLGQEDAAIEARTADEVPYFFSLLPAGLAPLAAFLQLADAQPQRLLAPLLGASALPAAALGGALVLLLRRRARRRRLYARVAETCAPQLELRADVVMKR